MQSSHRFTVKLLSLFTSSKSLFSSGVTKEAAFPGRQLWEVWDSRKVMTLAKVLTQPLVKAGDWALCSHSSSFEVLALISELATAARSHPARDVGLHRQLLCSFFPYWPFRQVLQRQHHLRDLLLTVPAWQQLGWAMHREVGRGSQSLILHPTPTPCWPWEKLRDLIQSGVAKPPALD